MKAFLGFGVRSCGPAPETHSPLNLKTRDDHLRSEDFLFVEQHPRLAFKSTSIVARDDGRHAVHGELTIRGRTRPVTLEITDSGQDVLDPWGNFRRGATAHARIKRSEFGLTWNAALEAGGVAVGDEVQLDLEIELIRKPDAHCVTAEDDQSALPIEESSCPSCVAHAEGGTHVGNVSAPPSSARRVGAS